MKTKLLTALVMTLGLMQMACSDDEKKFAQKCLPNQSCVDMYKNAAMAIAGSGAVSGLAQVALPGVPTIPGQVPNTGTLPASVTDALIKAKAADIGAALQVMHLHQQSAIVQPQSVTTGGREPASNAGGPGDIIR